MPALRIELRFSDVTSWACSFVYETAGMMLACEDISQPQDHCLHVLTVKLSGQVKAVILLGTYRIMIEKLSPSTRDDSKCARHLSTSIIP